MGVSGGDPAAVRAAVLGWLGPVADGDGAETEARVERVAAAWEALEDASRGRQEDGEAGGRDRGEGAGLYAAGMLTLRQAAAEDLAAAVAAAAARGTWMPGSLRWSPTSPRPTPWTGSVSRSCAGSHG